nr:E-beta-farnesene synthase [Tanacetum cinerariifolium]
EKEGHSDCNPEYLVHQADYPSPSEEAQVPPRPDSLLHLPNEEHVLGYLKFSAKGTKREVFEMPIPSSLITADIQKALYYQQYLANVAKHRRYLAGETGSDSDSPAPKPTKPARKPKSTAPKAPPRPSVTSTQPAPTSAPAKPQKKKRKQTTETSDKPTKAKKKSKYGFVGKKSTLKFMAESVAKDAPAKELQWSSGNLSQGNINRSQRCWERAKQRRTSTPTGSSGHDESSYAELEKSDSEEESEKTGPDAGTQDEGQTGSNPEEQSEGQAGSDPGNAGPDELSMPSHVVHAGSDRKHMDLDVVDVSQQPSMEQMDEGFTAMAYPKVQENLKLTVEEQVLLEEPASSSGTLSSLQHLSKDISFGDLFFSDKPSEADNDKATAETEVKSMRIGELEHIMANQIQENKGLKERLDKHRARLYTLEQLDIPHQVSKAVSEVVTKAVDWAMQAPLRNRFRDLPEADMREILHQRMWETESYKSHEDHMQLYEALEKSMNHDHSQELAQDLAEARKKKKKSRELPKTSPGSPPHQPPPPPPPAGPFGASGAPGASRSSQVPPPPPPPSSTNQESPSKGFAAPSTSKIAASAEYQAWTMTDMRLRPSVSLTPVDLEMDEDMAPDEQAQSSDDEDIRSAHIPKVNLRQEWWKPLKEERPATSEPAWSFPKPLPLGGPPGQATIQSDFFFNEDLEYLRYDSKGSRPVLAVRTHMWILSVVRIKVFSMYEYDYMKKIVLRRADLNEHVIAERDFKYLYPSDFEDLYLLNLPGHLNHLRPKDKKILTTAVNQWTRHLVIRQRVEDFQLGIESYQTQLNLTKPQWDATGFEYKHDYTVIDSTRAVMFRDKYGVQMMMRFNEIHKFSDDTLQQIDKALDYRVKEFRINRMNLGLNTRFWTRKDVDRSKAFMFAIQKRLKTRRIFRNLESFVGGRARDLESLLTISPSIYALPLDRFDNNVSFEEEVVHQRLRKTLTHVLELSSCIYLDDQAWEVLNFNSAGMSPTKSKTDKVETAKKPSVKYAEQYKKPTKKTNVRGNQRNWNNLKSHQLGLNFVMEKKACFNCGDFNHLDYDYSKKVKKGTSRSQNTTNKSFAPRTVVHKPYRPSMRPMRSNMNAA